MQIWNKVDADLFENTVTDNEVKFMDKFMRGMVEMFGDDHYDIASDGAELETIPGVCVSGYIPLTDGGVECSMFGTPTTAQSETVHPDVRDWCWKFFEEFDNDYATDNGYDCYDDMPEDEKMNCDEQAYESAFENPYWYKFRIYKEHGVLTFDFCVSFDCYGRWARENFTQKFYNVENLSDENIQAVTERVYEKLIHVWGF